MTSRQQAIVLGAHLAIALAVVLAASVLGALHDLSSDAVTAIFGAAVGLVGGTAGTLATFGQVVNGKSIVSPQRMGELDSQRADLSTRVAHLEGAVSAAPASAAASGPAPPERA